MRLAQPPHGVHKGSLAEPCYPHAGDESTMVQPWNHDRRREGTRPRGGTMAAQASKVQYSDFSMRISIRIVIEKRPGLQGYRVQFPSGGVNFDCDETFRPPALNKKVFQVVSSIRL